MGVIAAWLWVAAAQAEQIGAESLAWKVFDSDLVVRGVVEGARQAPVGPGVVREFVAVRIDEVLHGQGAPGPLRFEWQTFTGHALAPSAGHEVVLFLKAEPTGAWSPRSIPGGALDLDQPDLTDTITEDCGALRDRDEILAHLRALPARPAALAGLPTPGPARRACDANTEAFRASWAGSGVDVLLPPGELDELLEPRLWLEGLTEPMHWFGVGLFSVERSGCTVGVPVRGAGAPVLMCSVPGGAGQGSRTPAELREAEKAARSAAVDQVGTGQDRVRVMEVVYQGTERRALLCDESFDGRLWTTGALIAGLADAGAAPAPGLFALGGEAGILGCTGRRLDWEEPAGTRSMLLDGHLKRGVGVEPTQALLAALPELLRRSATLPWPSGSGPWAEVPTSLTRGPDGRPQPGGAGLRVYLPDDPASQLQTRVRYLIWDAGQPVVVADVTRPGIPQDWSAVAGPALPQDTPITAVLEVLLLEPGGSARRLAARSLRGI